MMRYFNNLCVTILLSMLAISAPLLSVGVMRRTAIQELTKAINAHTISPVEARKKALSFKLTGSDLNDAVVKELIVTADSNGIQDILNPVFVASDFANPPSPSHLRSESSGGQAGLRRTGATSDKPQLRQASPATTSEVELRQEKKEADARAYIAETKAIAPIVTKQDFPTQKIDKDFEKEERNYFREPHEDETPVEKEESMSGASSRIKD
jgi:hypothetical protein